MKSSIWLLVIFSTPLTLFQCAKNEAITSVNVYVAGMDFNGSHNVAKLWKNGVAASLTDGTLDAVANSVFVSGSDVFIAGYVSNYGVVWQNGVVTQLTNGYTYSMANSVYVAGPDVYVAGNVVSGTHGVATVWKNGISLPLTDGTRSANANSVFVSGTDVYVAGVEANDSGIYLAKFWKNGVPTVLTDGTRFSFANSIFVVGSDVYVGGSGRSGNNAGNDIYVWKNGMAFYNSSASNPTSVTTSVANSIFVTNTDIYTAGAGQVSKNGIITSLDANYTSSIFVSGSDVYVVGGDSAGAKVWKNGLATPLTDGPLETWANCVYVAR